MSQFVWLSLCTNDFLTTLLFVIFCRVVTAFDEISSTNTDVVKEKNYNCPWCKDPANSRIRAMWPVPTYKPISWDKYYIDDVYGNRTSVGSGIAAGVTIGVFFTIFLLTFGCRMYSARIERRLERAEAERALRNTAIHPEDFMPDLWVCGVPRDPPPPYEVAITMPRCNTPPPPPPLSSSTSTCSTNSDQQSHPS